MFPRAPMEEVSTPRPHPRSRMPGRTAWAQRKDPLRLTPRTWSHCSSVILAAMASRLIPALFTKMSTRPPAAAHRRTISPTPPPPGEPPRRAPPDPPGRPRDERDPVLEAHHFLRSQLYPAVAPTPGDSRASVPALERSNVRTVERSNELLGRP